MASETNQRISDVLNEAAHLLFGDRAEAYGDAVENHARIAMIFNGMTGNSMTARDVALMQVATKLSRMRLNPRHRDSHVDGVAYLGIAFACAEADTEPTQDPTEQFEGSRTR